MEASEALEMLPPTSTVSPLLRVKAGTSKAARRVELVESCGEGAADEQACSRDEQEHDEEGDEQEDEEE